MKNPRNNMSGSKTWTREQRNSQGTVTTRHPVPFTPPRISPGDLHRFQALVYLSMAYRFFGNKMVSNQQASSMLSSKQVLPGEPACNSGLCLPSINLPFYPPCPFPHFTFKTLSNLFRNLAPHF